MRMIVPLLALILFLHMNGNMPDFAHLSTAHSAYLMRGWWVHWQTQMRLWHPQEYALWGGVALASFATVWTSVRGK